MSIAGRRAQGEDSEDEMQANEDEMEDAFELPDYLDWMDQKEQDQFVREMNKANKNEDDLENMTETDLKDLGIESESTRVKMLDKIRFYFGSYVHSYDGSDGSSSPGSPLLLHDTVDSKLDRRLSIFAHGWSKLNRVSTDFSRITTIPGRVEDRMISIHWRPCQHTLFLNFNNVRDLHAKYVEHIQNF